MIRKHMMHTDGIYLMHPLTSCSNISLNCKHQIIDLHTQLHDIFNTLNQSKHTSTKCGIIHSLFNFLFGTTSSTEQITAIKIAWKF